MRGRSSGAGSGAVHLPPGEPGRQGTSVDGLPEAVEDAPEQARPRRRRRVAVRSARTRAPGTGRRGVAEGKHDRRLAPQGHHLAPHRAARPPFDLHLLAEASRPGPRSGAGRASPPDTVPLRTSGRALPDRLPGACERRSPTRPAGRLGDGPPELLELRREPPVDDRAVGLDHHLAGARAPGPRAARSPAPRRTRATRALPDGPARRPGSPAG